MKDLVYGFKNRVCVKDLINQMREELAVETGGKYVPLVVKVNDKPKVSKPIKKPKKKNIFAKKVLKKKIKRGIKNES